MHAFAISASPSFLSFHMLYSSVKWLMTFWEKRLTVINSFHTYHGIVFVHSHTKSYSKRHYVTSAMRRKKKIAGRPVRKLLKARYEQLKMEVVCVCMCVYIVFITATLLLPFLKAESCVLLHVTYHV